MGSTSGVLDPFRDLLAFAIIVIFVNMITDKLKSVSFNCVKWRLCNFIMNLVNICSFVNLADVIASKPEFVSALEARRSNSVRDK